MTKHPILRCTRSAALAALLVAAASPAAADDDYEPSRRVRGAPAHWEADGRLVDVGIRVDGQDAPLFFKPGRWDRHYFQAFKGRNYSIVLHNNSNRRVGVLIAVDGLNVVNGQRSSLSRHESMYVLDPHEQADIRGWRTSLRDVRRFVFVDEERSYAERTGQANGDLGWIRVLAFREVESRWDWNRRYKGDEYEEFRSGRERPQSESGARDGIAPGAPEAMGRSESRAQLEGAPREDGNPGTGWGERRHDPVSRTEFRAESRPTDHIVLRYEYARGLRALGIHPHRSRTWDRDRGELGFAQPPRW